MMEIRHVFIWPSLWINFQNELLYLFPKMSFLLNFMILFPPIFTHVVYSIFSHLYTSFPFLFSVLPYDADHKLFIAFFFPTFLLLFDFMRLSIFFFFYFWLGSQLVLSARALRYSHLSSFAKCRQPASFRRFSL